MQIVIARFFVAVFVVLIASPVLAQDQTLNFSIQNSSALQLNESSVTVVISNDPNTISSITTSLGAIAPSMTHGAQAATGFGLEGITLASRTVSAQLDQAMPPGTALFMQMNIDALNLTSAWIEVKSLSSATVMSNVSTTSTLGTLPGTINYSVTVDQASLDLSGEVAPTDTSIAFSRVITFTVVDN